MNAGNHKPAAKDTLPPGVARAVEEVLWFYWEEQLDAFIADPPGPDEGHGFRHLVTIDQWFYGHETSAEGFVALLDERDLRTARDRVRSFGG